jgi:lysophospholipase L1-like esterase
VATPSTSASFASYVALGDSYTAAPGVPVTDTSTGCLRSNGNYPALVAKAVGASYVDVSCGGASTTSLVGTQQTSTGPVPPQFDALEESTELVTIGIGGNDLSLFNDLVSTCVQVSRPDAPGSPCRDAMSAGGPDRLLKKIRVIEERVASAVTGIHDRAPVADVVLVGYPQLVPRTGTCAELPLAPGDYAYVRSIAVRLGRALATAAKQSRATYVDILAASRGHDMCAGEEAWVNGINTDLERAIAFHPFAAEQQAVAQLVLDSL